MDRHLSSELAEIERRGWWPDQATIDDLAATTGDLVVLGAGGKMGVSLCRMARAAFDQIDPSRTVYAVSRWSDPIAAAELQAESITTISADLSAGSGLRDLPSAENVVYLAGRKFGTVGSEPMTWATNTWLPARVARRYRDARLVALSTGNVYPQVPVVSGGADESIPPDPVGEYAQSCLGRERIFTHFALENGTPTALLRLNYAVDCRYGVLTDLAQALLAGAAIDLGTGAVNVVWQGYAVAVALRSLRHCATPPFVLNVTGPETASVRRLAERLGALLDRAPVFTGVESSTALLSDAGRCFGLFGYPTVALEQMLSWTAEWISKGGRVLDRPTHFTERTGRF